MSASASGVTGIGIALAPFTFGLSLVGPAISAARIGPAQIKLEIVEKELQERELREERELWELWEGLVLQRPIDLSIGIQRPDWQYRNPGSPRSTALISISANEEKKSSQSTARIVHTHSSGANRRSGYNPEIAKGTLADDEIKINPEATNDTDKSRGTSPKAYLIDKGSGNTNSEKKIQALANRKPQPKLVRWSQNGDEEIPSPSKIAARDAILRDYADPKLSLAELIPAPISSQQPSISSIKADDTDAKKQPTVSKSAKDLKVSSETGKSFEVARVELDSKELSRKRAAGRGSPSIWHTFRPLIAITSVSVVVYFLLRIFCEGNTFRIFSIYYPILILVTTFRQSKLEQAQDIDSHGLSGRFRSPSWSLHAIIDVLLDFLQFVTFYIRENVLYTAAFVAEAGSAVGKGFFIALSFVTPEAPKPTGMVRIRWTCVCT